MPSSDSKSSSPKGLRAVLNCCRGQPSDASSIHTASWRTPDSIRRPRDRRSPPASQRNQQCGQQQQQEQQHQHQHQHSFRDRLRAVIPFLRNEDSPKLKRTDTKSVRAPNSPRRCKGATSPLHMSNGDLLIDVPAYLAPARPRTLNREETSVHDSTYEEFGCPLCRMAARRQSLEQDLEQGLTHEQDQAQSQAQDIPVFQDGPMTMVNVMEDRWDALSPMVERQEGEVQDPRSELLFGYELQRCTLRVVNQ